MSVRQQTYDQRFGLDGTEGPASAIARQDISIDGTYSLSLQWLDDAQLRITLWRSDLGSKRRFASTILPAVDGAAFLNTLTTRQPA